MRKRSSSIRTLLSVVAVAVGLVLIGPGVAHGAEKVLSVTPYAQEKSNWCWAAASKMIVKFQTGKVVPPQCTLVKNGKGTSACANVTGTKSNVTNALSKNGGVNPRCRAPARLGGTVVGEMNSSRPRVQLDHLVQRWRARPRHPGGLLRHRVLLWRLVRGSSVGGDHHVEGMGGQLRVQLVVEDGHRPDPPDEEVRETMASRVRVLPVVVTVLVLGLMVPPAAAAAEAPDEVATWFAHEAPRVAGGDVLEERAVDIDPSAVRTSDFAVGEPVALHRWSQEFVDGESLERWCQR